MFKQRFGNALIWFLFVGLVLINSCSFREPLPECSNPEICSPIQIAPGPEDFVLEKKKDSSRFLISACERRKEKQTGDIYSYDHRTGKVKKMRRSGDEKLIKSFSPHGMDIRYTREKPLLYVIVHDPESNDSRFDNAVAVYEVSEDNLVFVPPLLKDLRHLWSPNDLSVLATGEIYLTNDYRNMTDFIFKRKRSEVAYYNPGTRIWSVATSGLGLANGILAGENQVYVSTTTEHTLYRFARNPDGTLANREIVVKARGLDNIMPYGDRLIVTAHYDDLAFMGHRKTPDKKSPTIVLLVNPANKTSKPLYTDGGKLYSAASTALIHDGSLYVSQVFDPFLLVCKLQDHGFDL